MSHQSDRRADYLEPVDGNQSSILSLGVSMALAAMVAAIAVAWPGEVLAQSGQASRTGGLTWMYQWELMVLVILTCLIAYVFLLNRRLLVQRHQAVAAEQIFRELAEASADWVWETDADGHYTKISAGFAEVIGHCGQNLIGQDWCDCPQIDPDDAAKRRLGKALKQHKPIRDIVAVVQRPNGKHYVRLSGWPFFNDDGVFLGYRGVAIDTSALIAARDQVKFLSNNDNLTGLPNRAVLTHRLAAILRRPVKEEAPVALLAIDIERFGSINEGYGASAGDDLIRQFAERLRQALGERDLLSRYSNNEFIVLRERVSALDPMPVTITRLRRLLSNPFEIAGDRINMTARIGVYEATSSESDAETCLKRVQIALAHSKRENQYVTIYAPGMDQQAEASRRLEDDLRLAIDSDQLSMVYQPQMCLTTDRIVGAEALMRWVHPTLGEVSPGQFIPVAERAGMITELSLWALRKAGNELKRTKSLVISVNISALDFKQTDLVFAMERIVEELDIAASRIELEVTESVLISDSQAALEILNRLKIAGFRVALDDFGTGYAGLGYLQMFPFDKIKIDQSFVRRLDESAHAQAIVRSVITLAHDLGLKVVAEGVERPSQITQLRVANCDIVQGFFMGKPILGDKLAGLENSRPLVDDCAAHLAEEAPVVS